MLVQLWSGGHVVVTADLLDQKLIDDFFGPVFKVPGYDSPVLFSVVAAYKGDQRMRTWQIARGVCTGTRNVKAAYSVGPGAAGPVITSIYTNHKSVQPAVLTGEQLLDNDTTASGDTVDESNRSMDKTTEFDAASPERGNPATTTELPTVVVDEASTIQVATPAVEPSLDNAEPTTVVVDNASTVQMTTNDEKNTTKSVHGVNIPAAPAAATPQGKGHEGNSQNRRWLKRRS